MAAPDHLNVTQWPIEKVGQLRSGNRTGLTIDQEYHQREVLGQHSSDDHEHAKEYGYPDAHAYQASLVSSVAQHGIQNPGVWEPGEARLGENPNDKVLANGYHRYAAARALGHTTMPMIKGDWKAEYKDRTENPDKYKVPGWNGST